MFTYYRHATEFLPASTVKKLIYRYNDDNYYYIRYEEREMSDKKKSLADRVREKQAAANADDKKPSLADKLAAKRDAASTAEEADDENLSLAEKLAAKREAEQTPDDAPTSGATGDNAGFTLAESLQSDRQARRTRISANNACKPKPPKSLMPSQKRPMPTRSTTKQARHSAAASTS